MPLSQDGGGRWKGPLVSAGSACPALVPTGGLHWHKELEHARPPGSKHIPAAFKEPDILSSEHLRGKCKQSAFWRRPVTQPSICLFFQTLLLLPDLFHIKRAVNLYHRNRLGKVSDVCQVGFLLLFVIVKNNRLPQPGHTPASPHTALLVPACLSLQVSTHRRYGLHLPDAFTLETWYKKAVADQFL